MLNCNVTSVKQLIKTGFNPNMKLYYAIALLNYVFTSSFVCQVYGTVNPVIK